MLTPSGWSRLLAAPREKILGELEGSLSNLGPQSTPGSLAERASLNSARNGRACDGFGTTQRILPSEFNTDKRAKLNLQMRTALHQSQSLLKQRQKQLPLEFPGEFLSKAPNMKMEYLKVRFLSQINQYSVWLCLRLFAFGWKLRSPYSDRVRTC